MKKLFSLLLTAAMVCSLAVTAGAADVVPISASANGTAAPVAAPAPDLTGSTVILHTNDVHGAIAGYAKVAALKQYYQEFVIVIGIRQKHLKHFASILT